MPRGPPLVGLPIAVVLALFLAIGTLPTAAASISGPGPGPTAVAAPHALAVAPAFGAMFPTAVDLGAAPSSERISLGVGLEPRDPSGLAMAVEGVSTPGAPHFREFLAPSSFDAEFAPSSSEYQQALDYFHGYGLSVSIANDKLLLGLSGTPAEVGAAFHTSIHRWQVGPSVLYGPSQAATLPSNLAVSGALGLTDATDVHPLTSLWSVPAGPSSPQVHPVPSACVTSSSAFTPCQVQAVYGDSTLLGLGENGSGRTVAVVDAYDSAEPAGQLATDLSTFDADYALPSSPLSFLYPDPTSLNLNASLSSSWGLETALDMEWSHVMAEGAQEDVVFSPNAGFGLYQAINFLVEYHVADTISLSWGEPDVGTYLGASCAFACNATTDGTYAVLHPGLEAAALEGISVFAASGDCGAADGTLTASTNYPASDVDVTGVGGTVLTTSGTSYSGEVGWSGNLSGASCNNAGGAGGGWSPAPQPWYQQGLGTVDKGLRGVPDVGITAGSPLQMVYGGGVWYVDGTSDASPQWAGLAATADQIRGGEVGLLNPELYALLRSSSYSADFHDITSGNNGYAAGPGWEPISGIGTPRAATALPDLARGAPFPATQGLAAEMYASTVQGTAPLTVDLSVSAKGGTGSYPTFTFEFGDGDSITQSSPGTSHVYATAGSYVAWTVAFDSAGNSTVSAPLLISVGTTPFSVSLASNVSSVPAGGSVGFTATPSGGSPAYLWTVFWGDGTWQGNVTSSGPATFAHEYAVAGVYCVHASALDSASPLANGGMSAVDPIDVGGATGTCPSSAGGVLTAIGSVSRSPTDSGTPLSFYGTATGGSPPYTFTWLFGDGSAPAFSANATHVYRVTGSVPMTFYARLVVNDSASFGTSVVLPVVVAPLPLVVASATPRAGTAPLLVTFASFTTGGTGPLRWTWNFGDLSPTSGAIDPSHGYNGSGTFRAEVTVLDALGRSNTSAVVLVVNAGPGGPVATATATPLTGLVPLPVDFVGSATGGSGPYRYRWSFGDGSPYSSSQDPVHTYNSTGNYSALLRVTDANGSSAFFGLRVAVVPGALAVAPTATPRGGVPPLTVAFASGARGGTLPYHFSWNFGDGTTSSVATPSHLYPSFGGFTVRLYVNDSTSPVPMSATGTLEVDTVTPLTATASATPTSGPSPLAVDLSSVVTGGLAPYTYRWTFPDTGTTSGSPAPSHTFNATGTYVVGFSVTDAVGTTVNRTVAISVGPPSTPTTAVSVLTSPLFFLPVLLTASLLAILLVLRVRRRRREGTTPLRTPGPEEAPVPSVIGPGYAPGEGPPASGAATPPTTEVLSPEPDAPTPSPPAGGPL